MSDLFARIDQSGGPRECWPWQGAVNNYGYGIFYVNRRTMLAHRAAYALTYGPVRDCVLHRCDTPICCNPRHLFEGTRADNNRDRWLKHPASGITSPIRSILTGRCFSRSVSKKTPA